MNKPASFERIAFVASETPEASDALARLARRYGNVEPAKADVVVGLGGDGLMLQTLHRFMTAGKPIYGMHRGTVGFLMNDFNEDDLKERLAAAQITVIHPLAMRTTDIAGAKKESYAINEVSVFRQSYQAARLRIIIDGKTRLNELVADGVMVATPAGSTAYNLSCRGRSFRSTRRAPSPRSAVPAAGWPGALLPDTPKSPSRCSTRASAPGRGRRP